MKKNILFKILVLTLIMVSVIAFGCGCKNNGSYTEGGKVVVGGVDVGTNHGETVFYKADDLRVTLSVTADTIEHGAYVYENGLKVGVDLDVSKVAFGTAGEYEIVYRYGEDAVNKKIYIYNVPEISGTESVSVTFSNAPLEVFGGLTAKDSFGENIDLQILDDGGMMELDGSYNIGTFTVKFVAVDKAGQVAEFNRTVTVTSIKNPVVSGTHAFDVNDESFSFTLEDDDDCASFVGVSFDGTGVPAEYITKSGNTFTIDNEFFYNYMLNNQLVSDLENGDKHVMSVMTSKGKTKTEFTLNDKQDVVYDMSAITEFSYEYYPCFTDIKVEKIALLNKYQRVTPVYKAIQGDTEILLENNMVNLPFDGKWTLEIDLRGEKVYSEIETYYDLGYKNGTIYGPSNPFKNNLPEGYSLLAFEVRENASGNKVAVCEDINQLNAFTAVVNSLNAKKVYTLTTKALKGEQIYTQETNFAITKSGVSVLGDDTDSDNAYMKEPLSAYLTYTQKEVGGRRGAYRWGSDVENVTSDLAAIRFSEDIRKDMKKDYYITFDIYVSNRTTLTFSLDKTHSYRLWGEYDDDAPIRYFDESGVEINADLPLKGAKWVTVEIKIEAESVIDTAGISFWVGTDTISNQEIYFANFKVSQSSCMDDNTVNEVIKDKGEIEFEDIWKS